MPVDKNLSTNNIFTYSPTAQKGSRSTMPQCSLKVSPKLNFRSKTEPRLPKKLNHHSHPFYTNINQPIIRRTIEKQSYRHYSQLLHHYLFHTTKLNNTKRNATAESYIWPLSLGYSVQQYSCH